MKEVVLPSGIFATIRTIKWGDLVLTWVPNNTMLWSTLVMSRVVLFDGKPLPPEAIMSLPATDVQPVNEIVCKAIVDALKQVGIA